MCLIEALRQRDSIGPRPRIFRWRATVGTPSGWHDTAILVAADEYLAANLCRIRPGTGSNRPTTSCETLLGTIVKSSPSRRDSQAARPEPLSSKAQI